MTDEPAALAVHDLTRAYGDNLVVAGVSFEVHAGQILGLLGRNGCGKSTTMKVLSGALPPSSGSFTVCGADGSTARARRSIGYVPDTRGLFPRLTGAEHLELAARLAGLRAWRARRDQLVDELDLAAVTGVPAAAYSHGQSRRLSMAMALLPTPAVLLVDEPFDGVDPAGVEVITALITRAATEGSAVLLTTHVMEAASHADGVAMFVNGSLLGPTPTADLVREHGDLRSAWLALCGP